MFLCLRRVAAEFVLVLPLCLIRFAPSLLEMVPAFCKVGMAVWVDVFNRTLGIKCACKNQPKPNNLFGTILLVIMKVLHSDVVEQQNQEIR